MSLWLRQSGVLCVCVSNSMQQQMLRAQEPLQAPDTSWGCWSLVVLGKPSTLNPVDFVRLRLGLDAIWALGSDRR